MPIPDIDVSLYPGLRSSANPRVSTRPGFVDGTRPGGGNGGGSPGEVDWNTLLARTGTGTPDPTFNPRTDIQYVGAFRVPHFTNPANGGNARDKFSLAYCAPDGRNGPNGSVFVGGSIHFAEIQIPELQSQTDDHWQLNTGAVIQNWQNIFERTIGSPGGGNATNRCTWMKFIGGKLHSSWYAFYSTLENTTNYAIIDDHTDLENTAVYGFKNIEYADRGIRYCCEIPEESRSDFDNNTHFAGIAASIQLNGRSSFGHSFYGFDGEAIQSSDNVIPVDEYAYYPLSNVHPEYSTSHESITNYYSGIIGTPLEEYVALNTLNRETSFDVFPMPPDESIRKPMLQETTQCGCAFIPNGTNTVVYIGYNVGMRYGIGYKTYHMEASHTQDMPVGEGSAGWLPWSRFDRDNVFWTMNLNDISSAQNSHDPDYIEFGVFEQDGWQPLLKENRALIHAGDYDPDTGLLYLLQLGAPQNQFETQYIISVYQVSGGQ